MSVDAKWHGTIDLPSKLLSLFNVPFFAALPLVADELCLRVVFCFGEECRIVAG